MQVIRSLAEVEVLGDSNEVADVSEFHGTGFYINGQADAAVNRDGPRTRRALGGEITLPALALGRDTKLVSRFIATCIGQ